MLVVVSVAASDDVDIKKEKKIIDIDPVETPSLAIVPMQAVGHNPNMIRRKILSGLPTVFARSKHARIPSSTKDH